MQEYIFPTWNIEVQRLAGEDLRQPDQRSYSKHIMYFIFLASNIENLVEGAQLRPPVSKYIIQIYQILINNKYKNLVEGAQFGCAVSIALDNGGDAVGLAAIEGYN